MTTRVARTGALFILALSLSGCPGRTSSNASTHSVDWYKSHERERNAALADCHRDNNQNQDCQNAFDAAAHAPSKARDHL
jgi:hypothetical protein